MCAIIFAVVVVVLHKGTIPEHKSTYSRFVTDLLQTEKNIYIMIEFNLINEFLNNSRTFLSKKNVTSQTVD